MLPIESYLKGLTISMSDEELQASMLEICAMDLGAKVSGGFIDKLTSQIHEAGYQEGYSEVQALVIKGVILTNAYNCVDIEPNFKRL